MKNWTILIYANGNNEMEPEMYYSMLNCQKIGSNENVDVIMQIARTDRRVAEIMRPNEKLSKDFDRWTGVRRYYISKDSSTLVQNLGKLNMADPNNLYEFLKWGIENYPSKHYMVVLCGHGVSFIGNMTDLTYEVPYIMGTPEMCMAMELIKNNMDINIDILVLDMCYMNTIEVIYEIGKNKINCVKNIITYIDEGPFKGMPYDEIISIVQAHSYIEDLKELIEKIIDNLILDLIAFEVNNEKLEKIKNKFNNLAHCYLNNNDKYILEPYHLLNKKDPSYPWSTMLDDINKDLNSIVIYYKNNSSNKRSLIKVICEDIGDLITIYYKLAFAKDNYWASILNSDKKYEKLKNYIKVDFKPMKLSKEKNPF